jgi:hypothetical protein
MTCQEVRAIRDLVSQVDMVGLIVQKIIVKITELVDPAGYVKLWIVREDLILLLIKDVEIWISERVTVTARVCVKTANGGIM